MIIARTHRPRLLTRLLALLSLTTLGAIASPAQAQPDPGGLMGLAEHDYLHRDMVIFAQGLNLDDGQRMIVESLYEDYRDAFDAAWVRTQERLQSLRDLDQTNPDAVLDQILKPIEDWAAEKELIKERFEEDVKILLNPNQLEKWEAFQRRIVREKTLPRARLAGENLDLFHVVRDLHLDERTMLVLEPVMLEYDLAMDQALRRRNQSLQAGQRDFFQAIRADDPAMSHARIEEQIRRRVEVRDVNDRAIETIAGYLNEPKRTEFRTSALERGYPRVFLATPAQRLFREAMRTTGLEADMMQTVNDLNAAMSEEIATLNASIHAALRDHEPKALKNQSDIFAARRGNQRVDRIVDPTQEMIRNRNARAGEYVEQLREAIGDEQFARIPGAMRWLSEAQRAAGGFDPGAVSPGARQRGDAPSITPTPPQRPTRSPSAEDKTHDGGGRDRR